MVEPTIPYHRSALDHQIADVGRYLGELRYIDRALTYLDECDDSRLWAWPAVQPYQEYGIPIGETFPFTRTIRVPDPELVQPPDITETGPDPVSLHPYDLIMRQIAGIKLDAGSWGTENLASVKSMSEPIRHPVSAMYEYNVIEPLRTAHTTLQEEVSTDFGKLRHTVGNWEGPAAENFATRFYHPFGDMRVSQERVFEALVGGLATAKVIEESAQHSLMNTVHYLREMLLEQMELRQQQGDASQESPFASVKTIMILAAGASMVSAVVGRTLWAIGMEFAAGGLNIAASSIPGAAGATRDLTGESAEQLLDALVDAVREINVNAGEQFYGLERDLKEVLSRVGTLRGGPDGDDGRLFPIRPQIVDGVDSDDFRHRSS